MKSRHSGFSIIELMIGITLGLIVLAALTSFFVNTSGNRTEIERNSRQIENGRYAIDTLRSEVRLAGFYAELKQAGAILTAPDPCQNPEVSGVASLGLQLLPSLKVPLAIYGYAADSPAFPPCLADHVVGTDVLLVRRFGTEMVTLANAAAQKGVYVQPSRCASDSTTTPWAIDLGNNAGTFTLRRTDCLAPGDVYPVRVEAYYIRSWSAATGDGVPTLVKVDLDGATAGWLRVSPLVEGVQSMRLAYGIDNDGDGTVDEYRRCDTVTPCDANQWNNVLIVRASLLASTLEDSMGYTDTKRYDLGDGYVLGPFGDHRRRSVYSAAVSLPNRTGPRE